MDDDTKRTFDALAEIKRGAFSRIQGRREGEWKLTISIWGALAYLTVIAVDKPQVAQGLASLHLPLLVALLLALVLACLIVLSLHYQFLVDLGRRHNDDQVEAIEAAQKMARIAGVTEPMKGEYRKLDWSRRVQFAMSVMLTILLWTFFPKSLA